MVKEEDLFFKISLAEWSLNKAIFGGRLTNLEFPSVAANQFGIHAVEYVNQFFPSSGSKYANELLKRSQDAGVKNLLIMIDQEGDLGELYEPKRSRTVERHLEWIECAKILGCHSIRVNAGGNGSREEVADAAVRSLGQLSAFAEKLQMNVLVENHGGYSSDGKWLSGVISGVGMKNCGTLPDFGNFSVSAGVEYDRYLGMMELMPFAKGVSAKSHDFNDDGEETQIDYFRMLKIVKESGYSGYIGIEYEGNRLSEPEGIMATKNLLIRAGQQLKG
ncbi:MAG: sugar phosphate isomerase/epimerase [Bacteroidales bacterium]|nr:sugar phosphate isomerase/epimerase [Bacteroidales bacterium]